MKEELESAFRSAMRQYAASVNIVTCCTHGTWYGMTATAITSLCADPPSLLLCINRDNNFHAAISEASEFCVNLLATQHQEISVAFSRTVTNPLEKFSTGRWNCDSDGIPYLADSPVNIFCDIASNFSFGTHDIVVGTCKRILGSEHTGKSSPLLYTNGQYTSVSEVP
ncbi:flavin reductase family protein [Paraburkholderia pallida]|uniref:Flavin reductase n=1 Tax=Paraburkholderia pallida TaxID=2547399 RepID=A0A4P7D913_9BURK|nr:flavin reductase family protein [Paraburkholderia pallida]QBR03690.1 flavin reductase [Paraburkholderia pallida]